MSSVLSYDVTTRCLSLLFPIFLYGGPFTFPYIPYILQNKVKSNQIKCQWQNLVITLTFWAIMHSGNVIKKIVVYLTM